MDQPVNPRRARPVGHGGGRRQHRGQADVHTLAPAATALDALTEVIGTNPEWKERWDLGKRTSMSWLGTAST